MKNEYLDNIYSIMVNEKLREFSHSIDNFVWFFQDGKYYLAKYEFRDYIVYKDYIKPEAIVYLCGGITEVENKGIEIFDRYEKQLKSENYYIYNPHIITKNVTSNKWEDYMACCFPYLLSSDIIFVIPGWETSRGARIEIFIAQQLKKKVICVKTREQITKHGKLTFMAGTLLINL